jgi:hypothetical protein
VRVTTVLNKSSHSELHSRQCMEKLCTCIYQHLALAPLNLNSSLIIASIPKSRNETNQCPLQEGHLVASKHNSFLEIPVLESSSIHGQVMLHVSKKILSTALLDYIINRTTLVPDSSSFTEPVVQLLLGSLGAEAFMSSRNLTASIKREQARTKNDWKAFQCHIRKACTKFKNILKINIKDGNVPQRLIIPIVRGPPDKSNCHGAT